MVILVDREDKPIGTMDKMEAHEKGLLHRAFSIFIFNTNREMLLQQRSIGKYHSGGLWTNACCSHPRPGEKTLDAAYRRLNEEMGFTTLIEENFSFIYKTKFDNGLIEHEVDHVFTGTYDGIITPDKTEVESFKYCPMGELSQLINDTPDEFTSWFKIAFPKLEAYLATA